MKLIKELSEMIEDEIEGAEEYAKEAVHYKRDDPVLAKTFYDIANVELQHVNMLHEQVVRIIEQHRKEHGEPPAPMQAVYDYLHKKHIEEVVEVKNYLAMYRE
jgi:Mn-containing catalase